jgi:hypothetical protein
MKKALLLLTILFCCIVNVVAQEQIEPEEYRIYKALLEKEFITPKSKQIVISKFTTFADLDEVNTSSFIRRKLSQVKLETLNSYNSRNRKSYELKNNFNINLIVNLITEEDLIPIRRKEKADLGESYKAAFREKFSTENLISFSRVGFNRKMNQALIQVGYSCGTTCGESNYIVLSKKNNRWIITKKLMTWIP